MVAGYTGTQPRAPYTCIGDTVNLAARLGAHTKQVGRSVWFDGQVRLALGPTSAPDEQGPVLFKGRSDPTAVWALGPRSAA